MSEPPSPPAPLTFQPIAPCGHRGLDHPLGVRTHELAVQRALRVGVGDHRSTERAEILCDNHVSRLDGRIPEPGERPRTAPLHLFDDLSVHARGVVRAAEVDQRQPRAELLHAGRVMTFASGYGSISR